MDQNIHVDYKSMDWALLPLTLRNTWFKKSSISNIFKTEKMSLYSNLKAQCFEVLKMNFWSWLFFKNFQENFSKKWKK
jgi:hypothetical protein